MNSAKWDNRQAFKSGARTRAMEHLVQRLDVVLAGARATQKQFQCELQSREARLKEANRVIREPHSWAI
jgi:hypothetical protein